jgi:agmatine deiminase
MPPTVYGKPNEAGKTPIRSYLNYAATNGAVYFIYGARRSAILRDTENGVMIYPWSISGRQVIRIDSVM